MDSMDRNRTKPVNLESLPEHVLHDIFIRLMRHDSLQTALKFGSCSKTLLGTLRRIPTVIALDTGEREDDAAELELSLTNMLRKSHGLQNLFLCFNIYRESLLTSWLLDVRESLSYLSLNGNFETEFKISWKLLRLNLPKLQGLRLSWVNLPIGPLHFGLPNLTSLKLICNTGVLEETFINSFPLLRVLHIVVFTGERDYPSPLTIRLPCLEELSLQDAFGTMVDAPHLTRLCCQGGNDITLRRCGLLQSVHLSDESIVQFEDENLELMQKPALSLFYAIRVASGNPKYMSSYLPLLADTSTLTWMKMVGTWPADVQLGQLPRLTCVELSVSSEFLKCLVGVGTLPSLTQLSIRGDERFEYAELVLLDQLLENAPALKTIHLRQMGPGAGTAGKMFLDDVFIPWVVRAGRAFPDVKFRFGSMGDELVLRCPICIHLLYED